MYLLRYESRHISLMGLTHCCRPGWWSMMPSWCWKNIMRYREEESPWRAALLGVARSGIHRRLNIAVVGGGLYSGFSRCPVTLGLVLFHEFAWHRLAGDSGVSGRLANDYSLCWCRCWSGSITPALPCAGLESSL